jgi:uncharacterized integral membrane protein
MTNATEIINRLLKEDKLHLPEEKWNWKEIKEIVGSAIVGALLVVFVIAYFVLAI